MKVDLRASPLHFLRSGKANKKSTQISTRDSDDIRVSLNDESNNVFAETVAASSGFLTAFAVARVDAVDGNAARESPTVRIAEALREDHEILGALLSDRPASSG
jgi:hypothetical protein